MTNGQAADSTPHPFNASTLPRFNVHSPHGYQHYNRCQCAGETVSVVGGFAVFARVFLRIFRVPWHGSDRGWVPVPDVGHSVWDRYRPAFRVDWILVPFDVFQRGRDAGGHFWSY